MVSLKHDGTAYTGRTAGLVADRTDYKDGTAIQLLVEQTEVPIQTGQPFMEQMGQLCSCVTVSYLYLLLEVRGSFEKTAVP